MICLAVSIGTAKPMPTLPPLWLPPVSICELMPITRPVASMQRAAGVAGVDRRVGLDDVVDREAVGRLDRALERRDDAGGERALEAERVADRDRRIADLDGAARSRATSGLRSRPLGVDLEQREVGGRVLADDLGAHAALVGELRR